MLLISMTKNRSGPLPYTLQPSPARLLAYRRKVLFVISHNSRCKEDLCWSHFLKTPLEVDTSPDNLFFADDDPHDLPRRWDDEETLVRPLRRFARTLLYRPQVGFLVLVLLVRPSSNTNTLPSRE